MRNRTCYQCGNELTTAQVIEGQRALECANEQKPEFEGWVHCKGDSTNFLREFDYPMRAEFRAAGVEFFPSGLVVCASCVKDTFKKETGQTLDMEVTTK